MKIELEIANATLADVLGRAVFGYWGTWSKETTGASIARMLAGGKSITVHEIPEDHDETLLFLDSAAIKRGIALMAKKYPHKLLEILDDGSTDAYTGDFLLQMALFGEEKYA